MHVWSRQTGFRIFVKLLGLLASLASRGMTRRSVLITSGTGGGGCFTVVGQISVAVSVLNHGSLTILLRWEAEALWASWSCSCSRYLPRLSSPLFR